MCIVVRRYINTANKDLSDIFFPEFAYRGGGRWERGGPVGIKGEVSKWDGETEWNRRGGEGNDNSTAYSKSNFRMITWNICCDT